MPIYPLRTYSMKYLVLFLILCSSKVLFAQSGYLVGECQDLNKKRLYDVTIYVIDKDTSAFLSADGYFKIPVSKNHSYKVIFSFENLKEVRNGYYDNRDSLRLGVIKFQVKDIDGGFTVRGTKAETITRLPLIDLQRNNVTTESFLKYGAMGVSSNNELTSNYNVRGGNYDENLVYVNGFQINRPFLTRSGQQEGLSFINTALVNNIRFSAGGFDAVYGDKLSSVLDIDYKVPDSLNASFALSLMGVETHVAQKVNSKLDYVLGARYRSNGYLLNSLPTKGNYNPVFYDAQTLINYQINPKLTWSTMIHYSSNDYRFAPETQTSDFGYFNEAYQLKIYFDGQEQSRFQTLTAATSLKYKPSDKTNLDFYLSVFNTQEREYFDIQAQYFINELESNMSKENVGDSIGTVGIGSYMNHARNQLSATIINIYHNGSHVLNQRQRTSELEEQIVKTQRLQWGVNFQKDLFEDQLSEWRMTDSSGYSLPNNFSGPLQLNEVIKGKLSMNSSRYTGYLQHAYSWSGSRSYYPVAVKYKDDQGVKHTVYDTLYAPRRLAINSGIRTGYTAINDEFYLTPRFSISYSPRIYYYNDGQIKRRNTQLRLATGLYYQPPFYREFRTFSGDLNLNVKAQKSLHIVAGGDYFFEMWNRDTPFKFSAEAYYKYLWDVNTYEIDNVRTRYYANNDAVGYMYGLDLNVYGEFIPGLHSFFKVGLMSAKEDIKGDQYTNYYNSDGEVIYFGYTPNDVVVDSVIVRPGFIPKPTDQLLNISVLFQDRMPGYERFSAQLGLIFNTSLPYGPPDFERYKDTLRMKSYFRVDLGMSYDLLEKGKRFEKKGFNRISDAILSLEVFNLLGIDNVMSKQWIQDIEGKYYSVPNYLTQRRINLKLIVRF